MPVVSAVPRDLYQAPPLADDGRDGGQGLHVIDDGGFLPQTGHARERRFHAGIAALAFDGFDERGFLAADIAAEPGADFDIKGEVGAEELLAQIAFGPGLLDGLVQPVLGEVVFAPDVDEALAGPHRKAGNGHALQDLVGVAFHDIAVLDGARLAFIGVADDVFRGTSRGRVKDHLRPAGKPAPPRPRMPEVFTSSTTCSGVMLVTTFFKVV